MTTEATAILDGGEQPAAVSTPPADGSQPAAPTNGQGNQPWYAGADYTDDDRTVLTNKGWDKLPNAVPKPVLESYKQLERIMGNKANAIVLPKSDDAKGMDELFSKLGRPESADKYELPKALTPDKAQNIDADSLKAYQSMAHKARLTNEQYGTIITELEAVTAAEDARKTVAFNAEVSRTVEKLRTEFGADQYGEQVARGNLAMNQLGISKQEMAAMSEAIGVEKATRMLMKVGGALAQHKAVGLDNGGKPAESFVTDKAQALAKISRIKMLTGDATGPDADFRKAMMDPGHPEHRNVTSQWREWNRVANSK